jgi:hypothetical protein
MDVSKVLAELRQEREQIDEAILSLERLIAGRGKRRGRPPAWMGRLTARETRTSSRPRRSYAGRLPGASFASGGAGAPRWSFPPYWPKPFGGAAKFAASGEGRTG